MVAKAVTCQSAAAAATSVAMPMASLTTFPCTSSILFDRRLSVAEMLELWSLQPLQGHLPGPAASSQTLVGDHPSHCRSRWLAPLCMPSRSAQFRGMSAWLALWALGQSVHLPVQCWTSPEERILHGRQGRGPLGSCWKWHLPHRQGSPSYRARPHPDSGAWDLPGVP